MKKTQTINHFNFEFEVDSVIPTKNLKSHPRFEKFLNMARSMSEVSNFHKYRLGAVLVIKGKIIARGFNAAKSHPLQKRYNIERTDIYDSAPHYIHAEMDVVKKIKGTGIDLKHAELFIYHVSPTGEQKMARPCAACMSAIKECGIGIIHYSTPDGLATEYISPDQKINVHRGRKPV